jgi:hypothetical protein
VALLLKLVISCSTFGTNDVMTFYGFGRSLSEHGLGWTYGHGIVWLSSTSAFNHPPMIAYFVRAIYRLSQSEALKSAGITFPLLLRLPAIVADFGTTLAMLALCKQNALLRSHRWALVLFAVSPVSIMVSGFHGNTDPVMVFFLVTSCYFACRGQALLCGILFALSCQVKVIPLLFLPVFVFFWWHHHGTRAFLVAMVMVSVALCWEPLTQFPALLIKNVLTYSSYWGLWGVTYWLRLTGVPHFVNVWYENFSMPQKIIAAGLKMLIAGSVVGIGWRRRALGGAALMESLGYGWMVFFVFSPGVCAQYLVWLAPFVLVLSPTFYGWLTLTSSVFLFFFYNTISHGLPWYLGVSTSQLNLIWTPWALWPWAALILGAIILYRRRCTTGTPLPTEIPT